MAFFFFILLWLFLLVMTAAVVTLVLMQEGKGGSLTGSMGASMGETFGFGGATRQIKKFTAIAAGIFMFLCIITTIVARRAVTGGNDDFLNTPGLEATTPAVAPAITSDPVIIDRPEPGTQVIPQSGTVPVEAPTGSAVQPANVPAATTTVE